MKETENKPGVSASETKKTEKKSFFKRKWVRVTYLVLVHLFAIYGAIQIGGLVIFKLGLTNNSGTIDKNSRYLMEVSEMNDLSKSGASAQERIQVDLDQYVKMAVFGRFYPENARLMMQTLRTCDNPAVVSQMIAAAELYTDKNDEYKDYLAQVDKAYKSMKQQQNPNVIPWMATEEWAALKPAILKDKVLIDSAAHITGVDPRLIVGCLVGEQMRLFNSKREIYKTYLAPRAILSVQSQFSLGVNGIKDFTAMKVERNLKDPNSEYYMGKEYEHILDFHTADHTTERVNRLVDYHNHLYSYIYTGCILHQTMMQWKRAGYDISNRPDILFTLFNVGFSQSQPKPDPRCGGSHINIAGKVYTFGAIGFDFFFSGEMSDAFPLHETYFRPQQSETEAAQTDSTNSKNLSKNVTI
ncbi:MAG: hypothetical protein J6T33_03320 [Bacteroidales bacterium]|nr:hypothetical protein [Bacteroidales bacterium]MBP5240556.1 hypothetical protein [Bacteroidales bacterium]